MKGRVARPSSIQGADGGGRNPLSRTRVRAHMRDNQNRPPPSAPCPPQAGIAVPESRL